MNRPAKIILFLFVLLVAAVAVAGYFFWQYQQTKKLADNPTQTEVERIINLVGKHVVLPEGEIPTVATVTSVEELQDQPFFRNAQNGYQVLVYQESGLAVMYDPQRNLVVNMAQITPSSTGETTGEVPQSLEPVAEPVVETVPEAQVDSTEETQ